MIQYIRITLLALCCLSVGCLPFPNRFQAKSVASTGFGKEEGFRSFPWQYAGSDDDYHYFVRHRSDAEYFLPIPMSVYMISCKVPRNQVVSIDCEIPLTSVVERWKYCIYQATPRGMVFKQYWANNLSSGPDNDTVSSFFLHRKMSVPTNGGKGAGEATVVKVTNIRRASSEAYHSIKTIPDGDQVYRIKVTQCLEATDATVKLDKKSVDASVLFFRGYHGEWKAEPSNENTPESKYY